jgi:hypothetical protein
MQTEPPHVGCYNPIRVLPVIPGLVRLPSLLLFTLLSYLTFAAAPSATAADKGTRLTFCCTPANDLFVALKKYKFKRFDAPLTAVERAARHSTVLILADNYPAETTAIEPGVFRLAEEKDIVLFLEYPRAIPSLTFGPPQPTTWERVIVSSDLFGQELPKLRILAAHDCHFLPVTNGPPADLVVARVAGYDRALYGLPSTGAFPLLFSVPGKKLLVATTKLSGFITARFAPRRDWEFVWENILRELGASLDIKVSTTPVVASAYGPDDKLPSDYQSEAFDNAARWFSSSGLLLSAAEKNLVHAALQSNGETMIPPRFDFKGGNGSLGILEGFSSAIQWDGSQPRRLPLRADCNAESAMVLALTARLRGNPVLTPAATAQNLLDYVYFNSDICGGARANPKSAAYGLIGWGAIAPAWLVANYGDDNARTILATVVAGAALNTHRYDERVTRALVANLRTSGQFGFRGDRIDLPALEKNTWPTFYNATPINYSPHFESYLWACYLWAYAQTHAPLFLQRATTAISMTMKAYPDKWRLQDNLERAHMLLCLAWLVRVEDTPEHREWLHRVATDLLASQTGSGAIHECLPRAQAGHYQVPLRNEDYGTGETPLLQQNGDPVSDQLYTTGFALLGLHEAVAATGDKKLADAETRLAQFLCRIQTRSTKLPYLSGTWFRAFDDQRWEPWASSADVGWGAWSVEAGWGQAWIPAVLALRESNTSVWDFTRDSHVAKYFHEVERQMFDLP